MVHFPHGNAKNTYRVRQVSENGNAIRHTQREDLDEHLQVLTAIMTDLTVDVAKTSRNVRLFSVLEGRFSTYSFTTVRTDNHRFMGSRVTVNERFTFSILNKSRKLEYYPKIRNNVKKRKIR